MTIILTTQQDALDCVSALLAAGRVYVMRRGPRGEYEITIPE